MDNVAYLNQISSKQKPKSSIPDMLQKLKLPLIALVSLIIIIIVISKISGALNTRETDFTYRLGVRTSNFSEIINTYQDNIKSSELRASSTSLAAILTNINANLPKYYTKEPPETMYNEESSIAIQVETTLDDAKLNGVLDNTYANQMKYAIKILIALIDQIETSNKNTSLTAFLEDIKSSLNTLLPSFANYSEQ